jgi:hypothetical protein
VVYLVRGNQTEECHFSSEFVEARFSEVLSSLSFALLAADAERPSNASHLQETFHSAVNTLGSLDSSLKNGGTSSFCAEIRHCNLNSN